RSVHDDDAGEGVRRGDAQRRDHAADRCLMIPSLTLVVAIAVLAVVIWLFNCLNILREYERAVVFRLGRVLKKEKGPGVVLILWPIDKIVKVSLRVVTWDVP